MALTSERIRELWENYSPTKGIESFARSVEAEVRKDDEALIRQMREALNLCCMAMDYLSEDERISDAITAADARLEKAP